MTRLLALALVGVIVSPGFADARGRAEIVTFGNRGAPGVAADAFVHRSTAGPATTPAFSEDGGSEDPTLASVAPAIGTPTNRCSATNLGGGFTYSFANGVECASFSAPSPDDPIRRDGRRPRPPSAEQIAAALFDRAVSLAPDPQLEVAPSRIGLAGLRTYLWLAEPPEPIVASAAAGRSIVTAVASPGQFVWSFGDGSDRVTDDSGRSWTARRRGSIGHVYQAAGGYRLGVEVVWEARWREGAGPWRPLGYFSTADSRPYAVREVLAWLVRAR